MSPCDSNGGNTWLDGGCKNTAREDLPTLFPPPVGGAFTACGVAINFPLDMICNVSPSWNPKDVGASCTCTNSCFRISSAAPVELFLCLCNPRFVWMYNPGLGRDEDGKELERSLSAAMKLPSSSSSSSQNIPGSNAVKLP